MIRTISEKKVEILSLAGVASYSWRTRRLCVQSVWRFVREPSREFILQPYPFVKLVLGDFAPGTESAHTITVENLHKRIYKRRTYRA